MRSIRLAKLDKTRPVLVLTPEERGRFMSRLTVAPITSTAQGLVSELPLGSANGLDHDCVASLDNVLTVDRQLLGRQVGALLDSQEPVLARAMADAFGLDLAP
ncbi:MAG: type II toxin-antitoxin system PemK/MazF family toxin [Bifidobacteriaceae bacterium]|jgi:mRNA interferase MazF|nr:type II toxin-antitoxin system PemK/MazF family toxin [Bifidobacteriaceae bacterium]